MGIKFGIREAMENLRGFSTRNFMKEDATTMGLIDDPATDQLPDLFAEVRGAIEEHLSSLNIDSVSVNEEEGCCCVADIGFADGTLASLSFEQRESGPVIGVVIGDEMFEITGGEADFSGDIDTEIIPWSEILELFSRQIESDIPSEVKRAVVYGGRARENWVPRKKNFVYGEKKKILKEARKRARKLRSRNEGILQWSDTWKALEAAKISSGTITKIYNLLNNPDNTDFIEEDYLFDVISQYLDENEVKMVRKFMVSMNQSSKREKKMLKNGLTVKKLREGFNGYNIHEGKVLSRKEIGEIADIFNLDAWDLMKAVIISGDSAEASKVFDTVHKYYLVDDNDKDMLVRMFKNNGWSENHNRRHRFEADLPKSAPWKYILSALMGVIPAADVGRIETDFNHPDGSDDIPIKEVIESAKDMCGDGVAKQVKEILLGAGFSEKCRRLKGRRGWRNYE